MEKQKKYGFINNYIYALNIARKSNFKLLAVILIRPMANIINTLLWSYAPKFVLSYIENNLDVSLILDIIFTTSNNAFEYEYHKTGCYIEKLRMDKLFHTDFKNMESPDFLDYVQRAKNALNRGSGFFGVLYESRNFIAQGTLMIVSAALIGI